MIEYTVKVFGDITQWRLNGVLHREDGPAIEYADGTKEWYVNGKRHREDGPAIIFNDGSKFWYLYGQQYTEKGFKVRMTPFEELTAEKVSEILG